MVAYQFENVRSATRTAAVARQRIGKDAAHEHAVGCEVVDGGDKHARHARTPHAPPLDFGAIAVHVSCAGDVRSRHALAHTALTSYSTGSSSGSGDALRVALLPPRALFA
jgi:hypothetical protein